jgi:hypothetical protein
MVFSFVDFPAWIIFRSSELLTVFSRPYWTTMGFLTAVVVPVVFVGGLLGIGGRQSIHRIAAVSALSGLLTVVLFVGGALFFIATMVLSVGMMWLFSWLVLWWPVYVLAFIPQIGHFPPTGISALDMDQITAVLGVAIVAAIRILHRVFRGSSVTTSDEHELAVLPPS